MFGWLRKRPPAPARVRLVRIDCESSARVPLPDDLAALTHTGRHVVLQFASLADVDRTALIARLADALPDHTVFNSGGDRNGPWVSVMPVVTRARVLERRAEVPRAVEQYQRACRALVEQYRAGTLPREWRTGEHGGHCCFRNRRTGQVVEAPVREWVDPDRVDPYFFALFVRSTAGLEAVAELITHDFHDAARMLALVAGQGE